ncbi:hypothetical protein TNCV_2055241 [Trichonephila clavipes]|uniref:Uncharacterized protein n=1 Tax=Trichonephila clavipes TaxID=2585209 RepID=A0A8X6V663_TRICX|nr:hypothetical protein TNCV_2055241 [Trichonephila clavipes]
MGDELSLKPLEDISDARSSKSKKPIQKGINAITEQSWRAPKITKGGATDAPDVSHFWNRASCRMADDYYGDWEGK